MLIDKGRTREERALILIENGHYAGYGYMTEYDNFSNLEELKGFIKPAIYYPDSDDLIRGWLKQNKVKKLVFNNTSDKDQG